MNVWAVPVQAFRKEEKPKSQKSQSPARNPSNEINERSQCTIYNTFWVQFDNKPHKTASVVIHNAVFDNAHISEHS